MSRSGVWWESISWSIDGGLFTETTDCEKGKGALWDPFMRPLMPFTTACPSWPNHLPKATLPIPLLCGLGFQHMSFGRHMHSVHCRNILRHSFADFADRLIALLKDFKFLSLKAHYCQALSSLIPFIFRLSYLWGTGQFYPGSLLILNRRGTEH